MYFLCGHSSGSLGPWCCLGAMGAGKGRATVVAGGWARRGTARSRQISGTTAKYRQVPPSTAKSVSRPPLPAKSFFCGPPSTVKSFFWYREVPTSTATFKTTLFAMFLSTNVVPSNTVKYRQVPSSTAKYRQKLFTNHSFHRGGY